MPVNPYYQSQQGQTAAPRYKSETARRAAEVGARVPKDHYVEDEDEISYETVLGSQFMKSKKQFRQDQVLLLKVSTLWHKAMEMGIDLESEEESTFDDVPMSGQISFFAEGLKVMLSEGLVNPVGYTRWVSQFSPSERAAHDFRLVMLMLRTYAEVEEERGRKPGEEIPE